MTDDVIARLRALHEAATPGPWFGGPGESVYAGEEHPRGSYIADTFGVGGDDAALIAAMRNALPALLDVAEAARDFADAECGGTAEEHARRILHALDALRRGAP